jgi:hypothetical protein
VFLLSNVFVIVNGIFDISAVLVQGVVTQFGATANELGGYDYSLLQQGMVFQKSCGFL